jgi:chemotaxis protein histidine kinase CheA
VPIGNVVATQAFQADELHTTMGTGECIIYLGSIIPLHDLKMLLDGARLKETGDAIPVIIIEAKNGRIALKVSEFIRPQKLVLIPLPEIFDVTGISGTTILGGNQLGMVLESFELINLATGKTRDTTEDLYLSRAKVAIEDETVVEEKETEAALASVEEPKADVKTGVSDSQAPEPELTGKLAEEFFIEIQDILTELNEDVFQLEKDPENISRVNIIFRHFHSIKGNLIMTGFNNLGGFVHQVETVLDRMRDKELTVNQEIIDLLLDAVKNLEQAVKVIRTGKSYEVEDEELLSILEKYRKKETSRPEPEDDEYEGAFRPTALGQLLLHAKVAQGANIFQSMLRLEPKFQEPFLVAYLILKRMALLGDVIDTIPKLDSIENGLVTNTIKVLFATRHNQEEVNRFFSNNWSNTMMWSSSTIF